MDQQSGNNPEVYEDIVLGVLGGIITRDAAHVIIGTAYADGKLTKEQLWDLGDKARCYWWLTQIILEIEGTTPLGLDSTLGYVSARRNHPAIPEKYGYRLAVLFLRLPERQQLGMFVQLSDYAQWFLDTAEAIGGDKAKEEMRSMITIAAATAGL